MTSLVCAMNRHFSESAVRLSPPSEPRDWGWVQGLLPAWAFSPGSGGRVKGHGGLVGRGRAPNKEEDASAEERAQCAQSLLFFLPGTISVQLLWNVKPPVAFRPGISIPVRALTLLRVWGHLQSVIRQQHGTAFEHNCQLETWKPSLGFCLYVGAWLMWVNLSGSL